MCDECARWDPLSAVEKQYDGIHEEVLRLSRLSAQGVTMPAFSETTRIRMMCVLLFERTAMLLSGVATSEAAVPLDALREIGVDASCVTRDADGRREIRLSPGFTLREAEARDAFALHIAVEDEACQPFITYATLCLRRDQRIEERDVPEDVAAYAWRAMHERPYDKRTMTIRPELRFVCVAQAVGLLFGGTIYPRRGWMFDPHGNPLWRTRWLVSGVPRALAEQRMGGRLDQLLTNLSASRQYDAYGRRCSRCLIDDRTPLRIRAHQRCGFADMATGDLEHAIVAYSVLQLEQLTSRLFRIQGDLTSDCSCCACPATHVVADEHDVLFMIM
jgi:hypothetical protein